VEVAFVHPSADVLAYGSALVKRAGYGVATASNVSDASVLVRATRPKVVVITPDLHARLIDLRRDVLAQTQVLLLAADFSHEDPGDSSQQLLGDLSRAFEKP
jgi:hypothetical protein